jgi:hypothetical protein
LTESRSELAAQMRRANPATADENINRIGKQCDAMLADSWLFVTALANRLEKYESLNRADIAEAFNDVAMV